MSIITFETANIPISVAAEALKMDCQTVRLLLQNNLVDWGIAFKRGDSKKYTYLIYPKRFYETTGFAYKPVFIEEKTDNI